MGNPNIEYVVDKVTHIIATISRMDVNEIDRYENLIEMGADSIILTDVNSLIREEFQVKIPLTQYFEELTTVQAIAEYIMPHMQEETSDIVMHDEVLNEDQMEELPNEEPSPLYQEGAPNAIREQIKQLPQFENRDAGIEGVLSQQLEIMNNQLMLLSGNELAATVPSPPVQKEDMLKEEQKVQSTKSQTAPRKDKVVTAEKEVPDKPFVAHKKISFEKKQRNEMQQRHTEELIEKYTAKTQLSKAYAKKYRLPYADWRNVAGFKPDIKEMFYQLVFETSKGSKITDIDGNEYIDLAMDFGVNLFGHNADFVKEAITREMKKGFPLSLISNLSGEVAELIIEMTGVERVSFFNSGTEAVMVSMRLARAATGKNKIVIFSGSYHGTFDGVLGMQTSKNTGEPAPIAGGILPNHVEDLYVLDYGEKESLDFIQNHQDEIAAVLVEPVQSRRPELQPGEFLSSLRKLTENENMVLIFDEIITGFRFGKGGAQEYFDVQADLVTYGKVVGGGMPIGIVAGKREVMDCIDGGVWFYGDDSTPPMEYKRTFAGGTFCHHPLTMAVVKAVLLKIKHEHNQIYPLIDERTKYLAETLNEFFADENIPAKVNYCGSLFRFALRGNMELFYYHLLEKGVYIWEGRNCFLSAEHSDEDIQRIIDVVKESILEMKPIFFSKKINQVADKIDHPYSLTPQQHEILAAELGADGSRHFNQPVLLEIEGALDLKVLDNAMSIVGSRHHALQYVVSSDMDSFEINEKMENKIIQLDVNADEDLISELVNKKFDLQKGPLLKVYALKNKDSHSKLLIVAHHLIIDGWSVSLLCEELVEAYNSIKTNKKANFQEVIQFNEYVQSRKEAFGLLDQTTVRHFWEGKLFDTDPELPLPHNQLFSTSKKKTGERLTFQSDTTLLKNVRKLAASVKSSPFLVLLSAYQFLLTNISRREKIMIGVPFAGQQTVSPKALMGNCDSVLPIQSNIMDDTSFSSIVRENIKSFQDLAELKNGSLSDYELEQSINQPKMNVLFNMDRKPALKEFHNTNVNILPVPVQNSNYDLFFNILEFDNTLVFDIDFRSDLLPVDLVEMWLKKYIDLIYLMVEDSHLSYDETTLYSADDEYITEKTKEMLKISELPKDLREFIESDQLMSNDAMYLQIMDDHHKPVMINSHGFLYLGKNEMESFNTGWIARITIDGQLELLGKENQYFYKDGNLYSLWFVENTVKDYLSVTNVRVEYERESNEVIVVVDAEVTSDAADELLHHCQATLPFYMAPKKIYRLPRNDHDEKELVASRTYELPSNETEETLLTIFKEVLDQENISISDNFFECGGHSLKATRVINLMEAELGMRVPLLTVFEQPTIIELSRYIHENKDVMSHEEIPLAETKAYYDMSSAQKRLFAINEMDNIGTVYNTPAIIELNGDIDSVRIQDTFNNLIQRHEILRTSFHLINGEPVQKVEGMLTVKLEVEEVNESFMAEIKANPKQILSRFIKPFQLAEAPLFRVKVVKDSHQNGYLLFDMHHIISDGESFNILMEDFSKLYNGDDMVPLKVQYKDYSEWMKTKDLDDQKNYWLNQFSGELPIMDLPTDFPRLNTQTYQGSSFVMEVPMQTRANIDKLVKETGTTEYMVLLSALMVLFQKYTRQEDIVIGSPISGRTHQDTEGIIGMFVNTLAMRGKPENQKSFIEFLQEMKVTSLKAYENQAFPFEELAALVDVERDLSRNPVFDVLFALQNNKETTFSTEGLLFGEFFLGSETAKFDLDIEVTYGAEGYVMKWEYSTDLFKEETVRRFAEQYSYLLSELLHQKSKNIKDINIITKEEKENVLYKFNETNKEFPMDRTVIELFEEQVQITPDRMAIKFEHQTFTYRQLNDLANDLAKKLLNMGIGRNDFVGILSERSIEMIAGIIGIIKAGAAYVPIDPDFPEERINLILKDCQAKAILKQRHIDYHASIPIIPLTIDQTMDVKLNNPGIVNVPGDLIYAIYTSGTTGEPKGVKVKHSNVVNLVFSLNESIYSEFVSPINVSLISSYVFDASVQQIFPTLIFGHTLHIIPEQIRFSGRALYKYIQKEEIMIMDGTPSQLMLMADDAKENGHLMLKKCLVGGEELTIPFIQKLKSLSDGLRIFNVYGPAETTVDATIYECSGEEVNHVPIGKPLKNTQIYIVNDQQICGIGMPGEILIAGAGVSSGYINRQELTDEKFIENPYGKGRLYCTGDLGRWRVDGQIEFLGRIDQQIKLRGYRIELTEIESLLLKQKEIKQAAVIVRESAIGDKYISAYVVPGNPSANLNINQLREELRRHLPDYMIPSYFMTMNELPITENGKLNKKLLKEPEIMSEKKFIKPRNTTEKTLATTMADILRVKQMGIDDNFFELGGDSIKAIRIVSRLRDADLELEVKDLMLGRTIRRISDKVVKSTPDFETYQQGEVTGTVPLTPIQSMFDKWNLNDPAHYNQAVLLKAKKSINEETLRDALTQLVKHHDMLRAVYTNEGVQKILVSNESKLFEMESYHLGQQDSFQKIQAVIVDETATLQQSMNLEDGPLVKVGLFTAKDETYLFICIHHLVIDAVSWRILLEDLVTTYTYSEKGIQKKLPEKTLSYKQWAHELHQFAQSLQIKKELPYWGDILNKIEDGKLRVDRQTGRLKIENKRAGFTLAVKDTNKLVFDSHKAYTTEMNDLLLTALGLAVRKWTGQSSLSIEMEGHGRESIHIPLAIDRTVGWFTTRFPVIIETDDSVGISIQQTKEMLRRVPNRGIGFGVMTEYGHLGLPESPADICFNYLGQTDIENGDQYLFEATELDMGDSVSENNQLTNPLVVEVSLSSGKLKIDIHYNTKQFLDSHVEQLNGYFSESLMDIIEHCMSKEDTTLTGSDLGDKELEMNELNEILSSFNS